MSDKYLQELLEEKDLLDANIFIHSIRLIEDEILRVSKSGENRDNEGGEPSHKKTKYKSYTGAVVTEDTVKLSEKVIVPVKEYPKFNFVGKLLGPRGNTLKRLQQATQTRMSILGQGSTRDKEKEEDLRKSDDPKYEHLKEPLHVLIEVEAPRSEAHARLAAALAEIKKYMVPENDEIRQEQMREMALLNSFDKNPEAAALATTTILGGRGRGLAAPIVRVGIPPPGAIILNGQAPAAVALRGRAPRVSGSRGRSSVPRHAAQAPEPYTAYDAYDSTYDAAYEGYPDSGEAVYYEYPDEYSGGYNERHKRHRPTEESNNGSKNYRTRARTERYRSSVEDPYRKASAW